MGIKLSDLGPDAQRQVLRKLGAEHEEKELSEAERKYHNKPTKLGGIKFDSKTEAQRFEALTALLGMGLIRDLKLQAEFTLQESYKTPSGERVRAIRYRSDFTYFERDDNGEWRFVVEDVKSRATKTKDYNMKKKLMQDRHGITIREVYR